MSFIAFLLTASFCPIIFTEAVLWDGARSTTHSSSPGWNPNPTPAPGVDVERARPNDLLRRQVETNVCGSYISGTVSKNSHVLATQFQLRPNDDTSISEWHILPHLDLHAHPSPLCLGVLRR